MDEKYQGRYKEREINIIDMLYSILLRWRYMVVWAILLAVMVGGYGYYKSVQDTRAKKNLSKHAQGQKEAVIDMEEAFDDAKAADLKQIASTMVEYQRMYNIQAEYNKNSFLMQLDANMVDTLRLQYYIDNHFELEYPVIGKNNNINAIVQAYQTALADESIYQEMGEAIGGQGPYYKELITVETDLSVFGVFTVNIYGCDKAVVQTIANILKDAVAQKQTDAAEVFGIHDITLINETYAVEADMEVLEKQQRNLQSLVSLNHSMESLISNLSEDELAYLNMLLDKEMSGVYDKGEVEGDETQETPETEMIEEPARVNVKYIALGAAMGIFIVCCFGAVQYILNNKLRSEDEVERYYEVPVLGSFQAYETLEQKKFLGGIDRWIVSCRERGKRQFSEDAALQMIGAEIRIASEKNKMRAIYVTGCIMTELENAFVEQLQQLLLEKDIVLKRGDNVIYNPDSLIDMAASDGVILVERVGQSVHSEIEKELNICYSQGVTVIGAVVIK